MPLPIGRLLGVMPLRGEHVEAYAPADGADTTYVEGVPPETHVEGVPTGTGTPGTPATGPDFATPGARPATIRTTIKPDLKGVLETEKGLLIVFSIDTGSELYEIWKRDITETNDFIKLGDVSFSYANKNAIANYKDQITGILGTVSINSAGVWLDKDIERNKVYEYKIRGIKFPPAGEWDLMFSAQLTTLSLTPAILGTIQSVVAEGGTSPLDELASRLFGAAEYGWVIGVFNKDIDFFGSNEEILARLATAGHITVPVSVIEFINEVKKGISSYSICAVIEKIARALGKIDEDMLQLLVSIISKNRTVDLDQVEEIRAEKIKGGKITGGSIALKMQETSGAFIKEGRVPQDKELKLDSGKVSKVADMIHPRGISDVFNAIRSGGTAKGIGYQRTIDVKGVKPPADTGIKGEAVIEKVKAVITSTTKPSSLIFNKKTVEKTFAKKIAVVAKGIKK